MEEKGSGALEWAPAGLRAKEGSTAGGEHQREGSEEEDEEDV